MKLYPVFDMVDGVILNYNNKIKIETIIEYYFFFLILCNLSILKVFPFFTKAVVHYITFFSSLILFIYSVLREKRVMRYYAYLYAYLFFFLLIEAFFTAVVLNYNLSYMVNDIYPFLYLLLSPVILDLLIKDKSYKFRLIRFIVVMMLVSIIMRITVSLVYNNTGQYFFSDLAFEYNNGKWIRNNRLRVNAPCFISFYIPLLVFHYDSGKKRLIDKLFLVISAVLYSFYIVYVIQTRAMLIYSILIASFIALVKKRTGIKKMIVFFLITAVIVLLSNTTYFELFFDSLLHGGGAMGSSVFDRLGTGSYFFHKFLENPLMGMGFLKDDDLHRGYYLGNIADIGIAGSIFKYGIIVVPIYVIFIGRWIHIYNQLQCYCQDKDSFIVSSILFSMLLFGINIDCFYGLVVFSLPFMSALLEYLLYQVNSTKRIHI